MGTTEELDAPCQGAGRDTSDKLGAPPLHQRRGAGDGARSLGPCRGGDGAWRVNNQRQGGRDGPLPLDLRQGGWGGAQLLDPRPGDGDGIRLLSRLRHWR